MDRIPPILQIDSVLLSSDLLTEYFCCDLAACRGQCCVEGEGGAPLEPDEALKMEEVLPALRNDLSPESLLVIEKQGVAYVDDDGDLLTSIVSGRNCVFTRYDASGCCLCASDCAFRQGRIGWDKPVSCALYPIREKHFNGLIALNYHRWDICRSAVEKGRREHIRIYRFLRAPLTRRFGAPWYEELEALAACIGID